MLLFVVSTITTGERVIPIKYHEMHDGVGHMVELGLPTSDLEGVVALLHVVADDGGACAMQLIRW